MRGQSRKLLGECTVGNDALFSRCSEFLFSLLDCPPDAAMPAVALRRYPLSWPDSPGDNLGVSMSFPKISRLSAAETKGS